MDKLSKRAQNLDDIISTGISDQISFEDAQKIVRVWGGFLEHCSILAVLFDMDIPESLLPYKKDILVGALNKMIVFYNKNGDIRQAKILTETMCSLVDYIDDEEALSEIAKKYSDPESRRRIVSSLKKFQEDAAEEGFIVH